MSNRHASIALLPFENLSGLPDDDRIATGFVQDLIAELARFPSIGVIAAESTFAAESAGLDDAGVGRHLGVEYLLKGSVRRAGRALTSPRAARATGRQTNGVKEIKIDPRHADREAWLRERLARDGDPLEIHDFLKLLKSTGHVRLYGCRLAAATFDVTEDRLIPEAAGIIDPGDFLRDIALRADHCQYF